MVRFPCDSTAFLLSGAKVTEAVTTAVLLKPAVASNISDRTGITLKINTSPFRQDLLSLLYSSSCTEWLKEFIDLGANHSLAIAPESTITCRVISDSNSATS